MGGGDNKVEETEYERAQADVAISRWNDYQRNFRGYEDKFIDKVDDINSQANATRASQLAISPLAKAFAEEATGINRNMSASGVNPNSGKSISANSAIANMQASAEVDTSSRATTSLQDNYVTGLSNVTAMGQGQAGQAMQGMSDIAGMAQRDARSQAQDRMQSTDSIRSAVGLGLGAVTRYGMQSTKPETDKPTAYGVNG